MGNVKDFFFESPLGLELFRLRVQFATLEEAAELIEDPTKQFVARGPVGGFSVFRKWQTPCGMHEGDLIKWDLDQVIVYWPPDFEPIPYSEWRDR